MKNVFVAMMVVVLLMVGAVASAESLYWNEYSAEANVRYMVCGYDAEEDVCFNAVMNIVELERLASENYVFSAYAIDIDGLYEIDWDWSEDGFIFYVYDCHGCEVEFVDFLPEIH